MVLTKSKGISDGLLIFSFPSVWWVLSNRWCFRPFFHKVSRKFRWVEIGSAYRKFIFYSMKKTRESGFLLLLCTWCPLLGKHFIKRHWDLQTPGAGKTLAQFLSAISGIFDSFMDWNIQYLIFVENFMTMVFKYIFVHKGGSLLLKKKHIICKFFFR